MSTAVCLCTQLCMQTAMNAMGYAFPPVSVCEVSVWVGFIQQGRVTLRNGTDFCSAW